MCGVNVNAAQILFIRSIKQLQIFIQNGKVFLFKHLTIFRIDLVSVGVILPVFFNLIDEKQRQSLDAPLIQFLFFFKVRADRFTDLNAADIFFARRGLLQYESQHHL